MFIAIVVFVVFLGILALTAGFMIINIYNNLVRLNTEVTRSWANIDVILKQRFDEIPQLIQVIEQFTKYEQNTIEKVVEARKHYGAASSIDDKVKAAQEMSFALKGIMAIGEAYPELKSSEQFANLQSRISALESQIADRREHFNECVTNFNTRIQQLPDVFIASSLNYKEQQLFQVDPKETARPSLDMKLSS